MKITNNQLELMLKGNKVVTKTTKEEMDIINLLVDNGYGNDTVKECIIDGVFMWSIGSKRSSLLNSVKELRSGGIEVLEASATSPFSNYYENTDFFVRKSDIKDINAYNISFIENKLAAKNGDTVIIYDLRPL